MTDTDTGALAPEPSPTPVQQERSEAWAAFEAADTAATPTPASPSESQPSPGSAADAGPGHIFPGDAAPTGATSPDLSATTDPPPAAPGTEPDLWASATPAQRSAYESARKDAEDRRRLAGTVSGLQRKINDLTRQLESGGAAQAASHEERVGEFFATAEWRDFKDEFPELAARQEKTLGRMFDRLSKVDRIDALEQTLAGWSEERREQALDAEFDRVLKDHHDYEHIARTPAFRAWYDRAPGYVRSAVERNGERVVDATEVSDLLTRFKAETRWRSPSVSSASPASSSSFTSRLKPPADPRRRAQLESAASPGAFGAGAVTNGVPEDREAAWKYFERIGL